MKLQGFQRRAHCVSLLVLGIAACTNGCGSTPPHTDDGIKVAIGPIDVAAGGETTQCVVVPLGNSEDVVVDGYDITLSVGSHHLIAYLTTEPASSDPQNCVPFAGLALGINVPIAFANKQNVTWAFPTGIGIDIPATQNVKIEGHYINVTGADLQGTGTVHLHVTPKASHAAYQPAGYAFYGTKHINIPPNASFSTGPLFQAGPAGTKLVSISTHQHRLGTRAQAWASKVHGDMSEQIANDVDWAQPAWTTLAPQFDFDGTSGITFQCDWTNATDQTVSFGESALDEMCFAGGYIYPSHGLSLCSDGHCRHGP
jgi:hypothetical protein